MKLRHPTRPRRQRGQSLVELALVVPLLLILVLGVIDFGRVFYAVVSVTNAAKNGAHYASASCSAAESATECDEDGIQDAALADTSDLLGASPTVSTATGTDSQGRLYADVTVHYTFNTLFPWPGLPDSINVDRKVRARVAE